MRCVVLAMIVLASGCADEPITRTSGDRTLDKAAVFGDPGLVPTREGEQARREAARAGEIRAAVELLGGVDSARVDVEQGEEMRALVVIRLADADAREDVVASTQRIVDAVLGTDGVRTVIEVSVPPVEDLEEPTPRSTWPIAIAVLGLGFSLGVTFDRVRRVLRRRRRDRIA
jgi:hypothetical protein